MTQDLSIAEKTLSKKMYKVYSVLNDWMRVVDVSEALEMNIGEAYGILHRLIKRELVQMKEDSYKLKNGKIWKATKLYKRL